jgi:hypothetical protein
VTPEELQDMFRSGDKDKIMFGLVAGLVPDFAKAFEFNHDSLFELYETCAIEGQAAGHYKFIEILASYGDFGLRWGDFDSNYIDNRFPSLFSNEDDLYFDDPDDPYDDTFSDVIGSAGDDDKPAGLLLKDEEALKKLLVSMYSNDTSFRINLIDILEELDEYVSNIDLGLISKYVFGVQEADMAEQPEEEIETIETAGMPGWSGIALGKLPIYNRKSV